MKFIWKLIYGGDRIRKAKGFCEILQDSTCNLGGYGHNLNQHGERIRERMERRPADCRHPLIAKYS